MNKAVEVLGQPEEDLRTADLNNTELTLGRLYQGLKKDQLAGYYNARSLYEVPEDPEEQYTLFEPGNREHEEDAAYGQRDFYRKAEEALRFLHTVDEVAMFYGPDAVE
jgi:hypothetical protein